MIIGSDDTSGPGNDDGNAILQELPAFRRDANRRPKALATVDVAFANEEVDQADDGTNRILGKDPVGCQGSESFDRSLFGTREDLRNLLAAELLTRAKYAGQDLQRDDGGVS